MTTAHAGVALALHGGAGARPGRDYAREIAHMRGLIEAGRDALVAGAGALDVVVGTVAALEASGLYVAGRGGSPNLDGRFELDAAVMHGADAHAGAVAALEGFESPIRVARAVMERTPHVLLVGAGAAAFARAQGFAAVEDPHAWYRRAGADESNHATAGGLAHGTVGCVARDLAGRLAAATSTAGVFDKLPGRVGDTPIPGAGVWADGAAAISCTGQGEFFVRTAAAARTAWRVAQGVALDVAAQEGLDAVARLGGEGGMIAVDAQGRLAMPFVSPGMKRAALSPDGSIVAGRLLNGAATAAASYFDILRPSSPSTPHRAASRSRDVMIPTPDDDFVASFQIDQRPVRGRIVRLGGVIDDILSRHDYPAPVAELLGEACALAALVGASLKFQGRLIVQAQGGGPVTFVVADFDTSGALRGYCRFDAARVAAIPAGFVRPGARSLLGEGVFVMTVDPLEMKDRYQGVTAIEGETLALCAEQYFARSEQVPTRVRLAVVAGDQGWRAGGAMIQSVAEDAARGDTSDAWETAQALFETLGEDELVDRGLASKTLLYRLFHEEGVRLLPARPLTAACRCDVDRVFGILRTFPEAERVEMVEPDGKIHVRCEYCARDYAVAPSELAQAQD